MKKLVLVLISLLAGNFYSSADTSPFQSLRFIGSARATALAGCFVSMPEDPAAVFYNPATVATVNSKNFSTTFFKHVLDINSGQVAYILPDRQTWAADGKFAAEVGFNSFGSFDYADEFGNRNGTFGANDVSFAVTYANDLDTNFYYGITGKMLFLSLDKASSIAFALDAGLIYMIPEKRTNIGLSILHVGTQATTLENSKESLPLDIRLGVNHRLRGLPLLVNFSLHHLADETESFVDRFLNLSIGGEFYFGDYVRVRLGYDNNIRRLTAPTSDKRLSGFTGGIGIQTELFNLDYGIAQMGNSALLHRFTLGLEL